jgi:chemotaxis protein methyltransferase CheR
MPRDVHNAALMAPAIADIGAAEFTRARELLHRVAGIRLADGKQGLVRSRLARRLRALQLSSIGAYLDLVESESCGDELSRFIDALSTNKTEFFREQAHFTLLERTILPALAAERGEIRIWCAGCSTGEEPFSVAIVVRETLGADASPETMRVAEPTRALVSFARLNLMAPWPMRGAFGVVFCRNTMIYFDRETQERLIHRFADVIAVGGYLFVGHSESLAGRQHVFSYVQPATYRR